MKYVFVIFTVLFCSSQAFALDARQIQNQLQQLENEISQLEAKYNKKSAELQACEKSSQNFKVAGIATLAGTGAGVMGNIALHKKYAEKKGGSVSSSSSDPSAVNIKPEKTDKCTAACANSIEALITKYSCKCN